jgi:hypothetical protein
VGDTVSTCGEGGGEGGRGVRGWGRRERGGLEGGGRREEWKMKRKRVKKSTSAAFSELRLRRGLYI